MNYIKNHVFHLKIIGHNSSRFDLPCLQNELFKICDLSKVKVIRKGCALFSLIVDKLVFYDSMNFVPSMSLQKFASTFDVRVPKGLWPYEMFSSLNEIEKCIEYPPISAFRSSLRNRIDPEILTENLKQVQVNFTTKLEMLNFFGIEDLCDLYVLPSEYVIAKTEFDEKKRQGIWTSMLCALRKYNLDDCMILHAAMSNFCEMVNVCFGAEVLSHLTLPSLAEGKFDCHIIYMMIHISYMVTIFFKLRM